VSVAVAAMVVGWMCTAVVGAGPAGAGDAPQRPDQVSFNRNIRPILSKRCFACHGPDAKTVKGKLRLDDRASAVKDRDGHWAIVPKDPNASEVMARVTSKDAAKRMPPPEAGGPLSPGEIDLMRRWIALGAEYEGHWSFIAPKRPAVPAVRHRQAVRNPIDSFVISRLEAADLAPAPEADRRTLIRRATLDLTGLPPTPTEVRAFVNDRSPDAYEKVLDRLLASPRFGEHQARYWLDAARYADTNGYQYDKQRDQWVWRDWVIHAFNTNMPFDRFTVEQMAGDLLPNSTDQTRLATGFHRNHPITIEGGVIDEEYRTEYVIDRVVTTSTTFMGLTFICARCHDHKYDPITRDDFYSFFAFFNNVPERGLNGFAPMARITSPLLADQRLAIQAALDKADAELAARLGESGATPAQWEAQLRRQAGAPWTVLRPRKLHSAGGATFTLLDDGSALVGGKNPATETYSVTLPPRDVPLRVLRLEAIPHPSLTNGSTSRGTNGNFVLSEITIQASPPGAGGKATDMKIAHAEADYEQQGFPITAAIDGKVDRGGWAVDGNTKPQGRVAFFTLAEPIPAGAEVRVQMQFNYGLSHQIGRFRFASTADGHAPVPPAIQAALDLPAAKRSPAQSAELAAYLAERFGGPELAALTAGVRQLKDELARGTAEAPETMVLAEMSTPRAAYVLERGEYDKPMKDRPVTARIPLALGRLPDGAPPNRLGLAQWLVSRENPLTARVTVNRFWARMFGCGIVKTVEDFGAQGEWPSHPDLLDWLAVEFMESGWDVKALVKTIAMSGTYRQSSRVSAEAAQRDPENRLLARGTRFRLDAEAIRDSALFASGLLDETIGGPSVYPYHPKGLWLEVNNRPGYSRAYPHSTDAAQLYRRSIYTFWKRTVPPPSMAVFDAPTREFCVVRRSRTNTPLQAFVLLNDPQFVEAARVLAARLIRDGGKTADDRLAYGFEICTARQPNQNERSMLRGLLDERLARYRKDPAAAAAVLAVGQAPRDAALDPAEHAAYTDVARMLMNLSEFVTKG
jgi:Protein of unknown function (DUF1553)/Protein of unknown function (DUF1549)/Planctomycete cytochrome C